VLGIDRREHRRPAAQRFFQAGVRRVDRRIADSRLRLQQAVIESLPARNFGPRQRSTSRVSPQERAHALAEQTADTGVSRRLEWRLLRRLPVLLLGAPSFRFSSALPAGCGRRRRAVSARCPLPVHRHRRDCPDRHGLDRGAHLAVGCCVVVIMKGPAYVADRYDLSDAESPRRD